MGFVVKVLAMLFLNILLNCFLALSLNVNAAAILKRDNDQNNYIYANLTDSDNSFLIDLSVGSDSQNVSVIVDTGSSDLWFPSNDNPYIVKILQVTRLKLAPMIKLTVQNILHLILQIVIHSIKMIPSLKLNMVMM